MKYALFLACILLTLHSCRQTPADEADIDPVFRQAIENRTYTHTPEGIREGSRYIDSVIATLQNPTLPEQVLALGMKSSFYYYANRISESITYNDSILRLINANGGPDNYPQHYASICFATGDCYLKLGDFNEAYKFYSRPKKLVFAYFDPCMKSNYSYRIARALYQHKDYNDALIYYQTCLAQTDSCLDNAVFIYRKQELLNNIALCYYKLNRPDEASLYYRKALDYIDEMESRQQLPPFMHRTARGVIYGNQAKILIGQHKTDSAIQLMQKSIHIGIRDSGDLADGQATALSLAELYFRLGNHKRMFSTLEMLDSTMLRLSNASVKNAENRLLYQYHSKQGDHKNALSYLQLTINYTDSLDQINSLVKENNLKQYLGLMEAEVENDLLKHENERKNLIVKLTFVISALLMIILIIAFYAWRISRKNVKKLTVLNSRVAQQKVIMEKTMKQLEIRDKEKDHIMRVVAHDLRNPLGGIYSLTQLMQMEAETGHDMEQIRMIHTVSHSALNLIDEIMEMSSANTSMELKKQSLVDIIERSVAMLRFRAAEKKQKISFINQAGDLHLMLNHDKMWRVINNLLVNAIKFSPTESLISIVLEQKGDVAMLRVEDEGIGIPPELGDKVFDTFTSARRLGTSGEKSFGLGLSITRQIIEAHKGRIWFESESGKGTTFIVVLPLTA